MKKKLSFLSVILSLCLVLSLFAGIGLSAKADNVTVTGTVNDSTTGSMLYLDTSSGTMQIKIDSGTDMSGVKALMKGATVSATVYRGDDAYMHASKITASDTAASTSTVTPMVQGVVAYGTTENQLVLAVPGTDRRITFIIDSSTTYTGISLLYHLEEVVVTYNTTGAGYVATNIAAPSSISSEETVTGPNGQSTTKVSGTIGSGST
ncbi:MAG TPA: hypothetical protein DGX96_11815, partial [Lachnospiraceae bacterium]|nr:hypothetical protein [Lachnospiraceae bacterium]